MVAMPVSVLGQAQSVSPGINEHYRDPDYEIWRERFESSGREVYDQRHKIVAALDLRPGMTVADIGAGTGLFTLLFASAVGPQGKVFAEDISSVFIRNVARRAKGQGMNNVVTITGSDQDVMLPAEAIDIAFICDTYHHFEYPNDMLASIHRAIKPGGILVVIDFQKRPHVSSDWVMNHVRADKEMVTKEIEAAGFALIGQEKWLHDNYFLRFRRLDRS